MLACSLVINGNFLYYTHSFPGMKGIEIAMCTKNVILSSLWLSFDDNLSQMLSANHAVQPVVMAVK